MADTPHFSLPFTFSTAGGHAAETDQDSADEVRDCVEAIVRTIKGTREDMPDFGITAVEFSEGKIDLDRLRSEIMEWEPRAELYLSQNTDEIERLADLVMSVRIEVGGPYA